MLPKSKSTFALFELYPKTLSNSVSPNGCVSVVLLQFFVLDFKVYIIVFKLTYLISLFSTNFIKELDVFSKVFIRRSSKCLLMSCLRC